MVPFRPGGCERSSSRTVAEALADLALMNEAEPPPGSPIREFAGPREESLVDVARLLTARRGDDLRIEAAKDPAHPDRDLYEAGALLPGPNATLAGATFEEWLDAASSK